MQRAKSNKLFDQDVKEAISGVKKEEYRRALEEAHAPNALTTVEHSVRIDFQLTQHDRLQLLGEIERAVSLVSPSGIGHEHLSR